MPLGNRYLWLDRSLLPPIETVGYPDQGHSLDSRRSVDLHVHPMVQIDPANDLLAVAPPSPLHANHEENILRVCSQRRRRAFNVLSSGKEADMLATPRPSVVTFDVQESVGLPNDNPDIDLIIADDNSSTVVFAETEVDSETASRAGDSGS